MQKKSIAIVTGGFSSEYEIAIKGADFYTTIIHKNKYETTKVIITKKEWYAEEGDNRYEIDKNDFSYIKNENKYNFDFAIIIIHGTPGENGILQSYFDLVSIPYSTGGVASSVISFDKEYCKAIAVKYGLNVADEIIVHKGDNYEIKEIEKLGFPMFIKPNSSGSSFGVTKVKSSNEIVKAIEYALSEDDIVLIEKMLVGREVSCGAYKLNGKIVILPLTEIVTDREFFDFEAKYLGKSKEITPADISSDILEYITKNTKSIYKALRCQGFIRVDYIIQNNIPYMIEVNNIPGMSPQSIIPQQVKAMGTDISELYDKMIEEMLQVII